VLDVDDVASPSRNKSRLRHEKTDELIVFVMDLQKRVDDALQCRPMAVYMDWSY
jgi:hypothetical protein